MLVDRLTQQATYVRSVAVAADLTVEVDDSPAADDPFPCHLFEPVDGDDTSVGGPRASAPRRLLVTNLTAPNLRPSDRVEVGEDGIVVELLDSGEPIYGGQVLRGHYFETLGVDVLYPAAAELGDEEIPIALFRGREEVVGTGDFEDFEAEAPVEFAEILGQANAKLTIGERRFTVVSSVLDYRVPRVDLILRSGA